MTRAMLLGALGCFLVLSATSCGGGDADPPGVGFVDGGGGGGDTAAPGDTSARDVSDDSGGGDTATACDREGAACDDGDPCTLDDRCENGACVGDRRSCDDQNPCTDDGCDPVNGGCFSIPAESGACDDEDPCTFDDRCAYGRCVGTANPACVCETDGDCLAHDDGDLCNGVLVCTAGRCAPLEGSAVVCEQPTAPCARAVCDPETGRCHVTEVANGTPCDDDSVCLVQTSCLAGACVGAALDCDDHDPCTADRCESQAGCVHELLSWTPCDDGDPATTDDQCVMGVCVGDPDDCDDANVCTVDSVDPTFGHCVHDAVAANGTPCDDHLPLTVEDRCDGGLCVGIILDCDDGNPCTEDRRDPDSGSCRHSPVTAGTPCDDGDACTVGDTCQGNHCRAGGPASCDDGNPCTDDTCTGGACRYSLRTGACDDGIACTSGDHCEDGFCVGADDDCDPCLADFGDAAWKATELAIGADGRAGNALDVDGDPETCAPLGACIDGRDNALAPIATLVNGDIAGGVADGSLVLLMALPSWPPPVGAFDIELFVSATPPPGAPPCDPLTAGCPWVVPPSQLDPTCGAAFRIQGVTYGARHLSGGGAGSLVTLVIPNPVFGTVQLPVVNLRIEADVQVVNEDDIRFVGLLAGAIPRDGVDANLAPFLPQVGVEPDLDLDGDGVAESISFGMPFRALAAQIVPRVCAPDYCFASGDATCRESLECLQGCPDGETGCTVACFEQADVAAQERYLALVACIVTNCPEQHEECILSQCWIELNQCD